MTAVEPLSAEEIAAWESSYAFSKNVGDSVYVLTCGQGRRLFATIRERDADIARLYEGLRNALVVAFDYPSHGYCQGCHQDWEPRAAERHAPGCLAAPREPGQ